MDNKYGRGFRGHSKFGSYLVDDDDDDRDYRGMGGMGGMGRMGSFGMGRMKREHSSKDTDKYLQRTRLYEKCKSTA
jgi:hypothetical protein